jgi:hypothetical protein
VAYGTTANTAAQGNDSRFNNAVACLGCRNNNQFVMATAAGQITDSSAFTFAWDQTNETIETNQSLMVSAAIGAEVPFLSIVPVNTLAKNGPSGLYLPVANTDGADQPTYIVTAAANAPYGEGYVATSGYATCFVDNAATGGDYVAANYDSGLATSVCHDIGASLPATCTWVVGQVESTGTGTNLPVQVIGSWYGCATSSGGGTLTGTQTAGTLPIGVSAVVLGPSSETEASSTFLSSAANGANFTQLVTGGALSQGLMYSVPNDTGTGTTVYKLAKIVTGAAVIAATTDTTLTLYPVAASLSSNGITYAAGTSGNPPLVTRGQATVTADASGVTANHYVGASTTTGGDVMDLGAGPILANTSRCLGKSNLGAITGSATGTIQLGDCPVVPKVLPFASLPSCGATYEGISIGVSDANANTWGTAITAGSSTSHVLAYCDATAWTVAGK